MATRGSSSLFPTKLGNNFHTSSVEIVRKKPHIHRDIIIIIINSPRFQQRESVVPYNPFPVSANDRSLKPRRLSISGHRGEASSHCHNCLHSIMVGLTPLLQPLAVRAQRHHTVRHQHVVNGGATLALLLKCASITSQLEQEKV